MKLLIVSTEQINKNIRAIGHKRNKTQEQQNIKTTEHKNNSK